jgi:nitric oxide synthase oxygenase domain/subunit
MSVNIFIENKTDNDYKLNDYVIKAHSKSTIPLHFNAKRNTEYTLKHFLSKRKFKLNHNGNVVELSAGLAYGVNRQYINVTRSVGRGYTQVWNEPDVIPAYYNELHHIDILC